jgi:hypothetical protein
VLNSPSDIDLISERETVGEATVQDDPDASTEGKSGTLLVFIDHCARLDLVDDAD